MVSTLEWGRYREKGEVPAPTLVKRADFGIIKMKCSETIHILRKGRR